MYFQASNSYYHPETENFQSIQSSIVVGAVPPISVRNNLDKICGKFRGIQGHHNSCYLDATLFSMFAFTCVLDSLLFRQVHANSHVTLNTLCISIFLVV